MGKAVSEWRSLHALRALAWGSLGIGFLAAVGTALQDARTSGEDIGLRALSMMVGMIIIGGIAWLVSWGLGRLFRQSSPIELVVPAGRSEIVPPSLNQPTRPSDLLVYLSTKGQETGPFTISQLRRMWDTGSVTADAIYWHDGLDGWQPIQMLDLP